jgi:hypothetical protein
MDMIEKDGLVHGYPAKNWEDGIKNGFGLKPIAIIGHDREEEENGNKNKKDEFLPHINYLYWIGRKSVKRKSAERPYINETDYPG